MAYSRPYRYPDGEVIPTSLPDLYQPADNPGIPKGQRCDTCGYYQAGYCSKFDAKVKAYYWCAKWKPQEN